jgi:hypothetical protein
LTTISAKIIADSISAEGIRLTTMQLRYPRFIHAELMTHRVFSRNARSSRAVPVEKMIQEVIDDPVIPIHWGAAQKGMQAYAESSAPISLLSPHTQLYYEVSNEKAWLKARDSVVDIALAFNKAGYAKQVINRLIEPWLHIDTLVSATEWANWFALRDHEAAEPHIQVLAREMKAAMADSKPIKCIPGAWHLPYVDYGRDAPLAREWLREKLMSQDGDSIQDTLISLSVARCARISYTPFDGDGKIESELRRYDLLVGSHPLHASPAEHQATPDQATYDPDRGERIGWLAPSLHGNFKGWIQFRKTLPGECVQ